MTRQKTEKKKILNICPCISTQHTHTVCSISLHSRNGESQKTADQCNYMCMHDSTISCVRKPNLRRVPTLIIFWYKRRKRQSFLQIVRPLLLSILILIQYRIYVVMVSAVKRLTYFKEEKKCLKIHRNITNPISYIWNLCHGHLDILLL